MNITQAEERFFTLIQRGKPVNNETTNLAKCGRALSTVIRKMGYVDKNGYYTGAVPIPDELKLEIKSNFINYNNRHKKAPKVSDQPAPDKSTDEYLIARLKYITDQLRARGYDIEEIKITYTI